jgi:HK97 family phage prohead protease
MTATLETRSTAGTVEVRASSGGKRLGGYALKYERLSQNLGGYVEQVARGAVDKTLAEGTDVLCRYQHQDHFLLGRTSAGTLTLTRGDAEGLPYEVDVPGTDYGANCLALAERGDLAHSSFAFYTVRDDWGLTDQGFPLRTLVEIKLVDVAPVVSPAYLDTTTGLRSLAEQRGLDLGEVTERAAANALAELLVEPRSTVIDLAPTPVPNYLGAVRALAIPGDREYISRLG